MKTTPPEPQKNEKSESENTAGFLILTRKRGERIILGQGAEYIVTYLGHGFKDSIRIGIQALKNLPVWREEVYLRIKQSKSAANEITHADDGQ